MISLTSIKTYMFCPLKLYLEHNLDEKINNEDIHLNKTMKQTRIDLQDLLQRNIQRLKKEMSLTDIENTLNSNIEDYLKNSIAILENSIDVNKNNEYNDELKNDEDFKNLKKLNQFKTDLKNEISFNLKLLSLKSQKAMRTIEKDGEEIFELFFPNSMYRYLIRDKKLEIIGIADKIEIINGKYFPISIQSSNPPLKGVWDGDAIVLVANALLIEQEFETEVFVGFVDYVNIGDRRPVVMDADLRKSLFKIISEIKSIMNEGILPEFNISYQKCYNCDYNEICDQNKVK